MEYLVDIEIRLPHDLGSDQLGELVKSELAMGASLAQAGVIRAIWRVPGRRANRGIWSAPDATALHDAIVSLPMWPFMTVEVTPLARHPLAEHCQGISPFSLSAG